MGSNTAGPHGAKTNEVHGTYAYFEMRSPESFNSDENAHGQSLQDGDGDVEEEQYGEQDRDSQNTDSPAEIENDSRNPGPCSPQVIITGDNYQVYDSDDEGNTQVQYASLDKTARRYDEQLVRKHVRPEFISPGSSWDSNPPLALPQVKSTELFLAFQEARKYFSEPTFIRNLKKNPVQRLSAYLAAEVLAQFVIGTSFDTLWAAAGDVEEYIRQTLWPSLMLIEAIRMNKDQESEVINLAKTVPPAYALGFNNNEFWGSALYMALRFPSGLHPFTTPVVRNALSYLVAALDVRPDDETSPWESEEATLHSTMMALAATWAGYHISHHLLTRNAYHFSEAEVLERRQWLDATVAVVTRTVEPIKILFLETIEENGYVDTSLSTDILIDRFVRPADWTRSVGACHRVEFNQANSLPLPICKPSVLFKHLQDLGERDPERPWDDSEDVQFSNEYDEPLDPSEHDVKHSSLQLPAEVAGNVAKINAWLLSFLRNPVATGLDSEPATPVLVTLGRPQAATTTQTSILRSRRSITRSGGVVASDTVEQLKSEISEIKKAVGETRALVEGNAVALEAMRSAILEQTRLLKTFMVNVNGAETEASRDDVAAAVQRATQTEGLATSGGPHHNTQTVEVAEASGERNRWPGLEDNPAVKGNSMMGAGRVGVNGEKRVVQEDRGEEERVAKRAKEMSHRAV
ncbi:hypothetical protein B0T11DRAFT_288679 [Plectosphaerella cucumerina]|uniref:Uncharacterized protein n=1 Tax=Plectosphaerella cucumerina TaxID=40658 RepID=A0A8K0T992_9PEZI|nr:hypothetical protein B0T11DRAFT_288679 [Plectosphaerella cucumerina]